MTKHVPPPPTCILALDLGTTTGFACGRVGVKGTSLMCGTWSLKPGRFDGGGMRFVKFRSRLAELKESIGFNAVYFEEVRRHIGTDAAHVYGGLMGALTGWCEEQTPKIPYEGVPVGTIKKFGTGKGNADKAAMIDAARTLGHEPVDDNEADAIVLFYLKSSELTGAV